MYVATRCIFSLPICRKPGAHVSLPTSFFFLQLDIQYDKFIRTTDPKHEAVVNDFYSRVLSSGDIYRADYEGLYCVSCEEYKVNFYFYLLIYALIVKFLR
jgi:hypothetical protein